MGFYQNYGIEPEDEFRYGGTRTLPPLVSSPSPFQPNLIKRRQRSRIGTRRPEYPSVSVLHTRNEGPRETVVDAIDSVGCGRPLDDASELETEVRRLSRHYKALSLGNPLVMPETDLTLLWP